MPYGEDEVAEVEALGEQLRARHFPFVIHYGDIKGGEAPCSDEYLGARRDLIYGLLPGRVFYTPGDNEWTDCDRAAAGGYDELERLAKVRELFFALDALPAAAEWHVARQTPGYPENARWEYGPLVLATLDIVGTNNGRRHIDESDRGKADYAARKKAVLDAVDARDRADAAWLDAAFETAERTGAEGVVIAMQADPFSIDGSPRDVECTRKVRQDCNPFLAFVRHLRARAAAFAKPVLLIHGDTGPYCLDQRFGAGAAPKLWRLNGPGDYAGVEAAVVTFDAGAAQPFTVKGLLDPRPPPPCKPEPGE